MVGAGMDGKLPPEKLATLAIVGRTSIESSAVNFWLTGCAATRGAAGRVTVLSRLKSFARDLGMSQSGLKRSFVSGFLTKSGSTYRPKSGHIGTTGIGP